MTMKFQNLLLITVTLATAGYINAANAPLDIVRPVPGVCVETVLPGGARGLYCIPEQGWNGDVIVFAHGYAAITEPLDYQNLTIGGVYLPELAQQLGFAFATTTYRQNGLAIVEGVEDVRELVQTFRSTTGRRAQRFIMTGASEGGIVTVLALERYPRLFAGGLALCGPIGNFRFQTDYIADFRLLFDYFFPGVLPGNVVQVPASMLDDWYSIHRPAIEAVTRAHPDKTLQLLRVANAAHESDQWDTVENTVEGVLWYHTFGTEDARAKLGGNPYGNTRRRYRGSSDDATLNRSVPRYTADSTVYHAMRNHTTSGVVRKPLVVMHTRGDEIIPFAHNLIYLAKVRQAGGGPVTVYPIDRYGHCNFTINELIGGLLTLLADMR
jgi:pimeloyl-ACP methyl ester carboxylesterase